MSIEQRKRIEDLERRVTAIEQAFEAINIRTEQSLKDEAALLEAAPPRIQKTLTLPEKRKSA